MHKLSLSLFPSFPLSRRVCSAAHAPSTSLGWGGSGNGGRGWGENKVAYDLRLPTISWNSLDLPKYASEHSLSHSVNHLLGDRSSARCRCFAWALLYYFFNMLFILFLSI